MKGPAPGISTRGIAGFRIEPMAGRTTIAHLSLDPTVVSPPLTGIEQCITSLRAMGYAGAITAALRPQEVEVFIAAGFTVREELTVLVHSLRRLDKVPSRTTRRARRRDRDRVLWIDHAAFDLEWWMSDNGIDDAMSATPMSRHRIAEASESEQRVLGGSGAAGYSIIGRAGTVGYLQRIAVHPLAEGNGIGTSLVLDALQWLRRRGARSAVVNTQRTNERALYLYGGLGFTVDPTITLKVLSLDLSPP